MSLRASTTYKPQPFDTYYTPPLHVNPLLDYAADVGLFERGATIWECAAGAGHVAYALKRAGYQVLASDLRPAPVRQQLVPVVPLDFLSSTGPSGHYDIVTNPPYGKQGRLIIAFLEHAFANLELRMGSIAMLLPFEFDSRLSRNRLVGHHPWFLAKITVATRIRWVNVPQKAASPMGHHAWFVWSNRPAVQRRAQHFPRLVVA